MKIDFPSIFILSFSQIKTIRNLQQNQNVHS